MVKIKEVLDITRNEQFYGSTGSTTGSWDDYFNSSSVDPTGSYLSTYITTIGLYDDANDMVAIAKLPNPIKSGFWVNEKINNSGEIVLVPKFIPFGEPMGINLDGTPVIDQVGGLWIRLTICESTRIGYGASDAHQKGADAIKSAISDAIKNAAMRFGVALDLWGMEPSALADAPQKPIERLTIVPGILTPDNEPWNDPIEDTDDLFHPSCKHGLMNYKSGTSSTAKKWEGYFCPLEDRSLQCATIGMNGRPWRK